MKKQASVIFPEKAKVLLLILTPLLIFTSCSSQKGLTKEINTTFEEFPAFETGFSGLVVYDPAKEKVIYQQNPEKYFTPASNTKLFTFYTGLKTLVDSAAGIKYLVKGDSLIFKGTGDPSFLYPDLKSDKVLEFLKTRNERLFYATPYFQEEHFGPGWSWDDYNYYYSVERAAMPIYGNYASFAFSPGNGTPKVEPSFFAEMLRKDTTVSGNSSRVTRNRFKNEFFYGTNSEGEKRSRVVPFIHTPNVLVELLSDTLNKPVGIVKAGSYDWDNAKTLYSIPTDSLYKRMLQVSDNFIAEQLLLMSAAAVADTLKSEIALEYMKENHLKDLPDEPIWVDGSGLSVYNKFTPRTMVKLLEKISEEVPQERLFQLLPAGGESGTIKNLYKADKPYIFAKTGTLTNVHALSGFLRTKSGKVLIFSFMNNNYAVPSAEIKEGMEKILRNIYLNY